MLVIVRGTHEDVVSVTRVLEDRRQARCVAERIRVEADFYIDSKRSLAVFLAMQGVANETLCGRDVTVRLNGPAAYNLPAAFLHPLLNLGEHLRIGALNPTIVSRR